MAQKKSYKWLIWFLSVMFYAYRYFLYAMPNVLKDEFCQYFDMNVQTFGQFSGIWYIGYVVAHIPVGIALDKYGPKYILPFSLLLCLLGLSSFLIPHAWHYPFWGRFLIGIGSAGATLGMFKIVSLLFDDKQFTKTISLTCIIGVLGGVFANYPLQILQKVMPWQHIVYILIFLGSILCLCMYLYMPRTEKTEQSDVVDSLKHLLSNKWLWIISLGAGFLSGPMEGFADAWALSTLEKVYGTSKELASQGSSVIYLGFIFGLLSTNFITKRYGLDKTVILCAVMMLIAFCIIIMPISNISIVIFLYMVLGFFSFFQVPAVERAIYLFDKKHAALATACFNMVMMGFGSYFHTIISSSMAYFGTSPCISQPILYQYSLSIVPLMLVLGALLYGLTNRFCKKSH